MKLTGQVIFIISYESWGAMLMSKHHYAIQLSKDGNKVYFNHNFHVEPTNVCVYRCTFCAFRRDHEDSDDRRVHTCPAVDRLRSVGLGDG